jgi:hypothetical protein
MEKLATVQIMVDSGLFILIWLVQLIIYPSFRYTEEKDFVGWHARYTLLIGAIVIPLMLVQVGIEVVHNTTLDSRWIRIALITMIWLSTFILSVPCHRTLHNAGKNPAIIHRLVMTNWPRTLLWSALFLDSLDKLVRPF